MTKSLVRFSMLLAVVSALLVTTAVAQMGPGAGRGGRMGGPMYDTAFEVTVSGTVSDVQQITGQAAGASGTAWARCPRGWTGTHLQLKTDAGVLIVHVGPSAYLASKNFSIAKDDQLTIVGSKVQYQGSDFLIAKQITKGSEVLQLRDANGFPLWAGMRRGAPMPNPGK